MYKTSSFYFSLIRFNSSFYISIARGERPIQALNEESNLYEEMPEMIPEIIVPDLTGFEVS